jgi:hypothetical protein
MAVADNDPLNETIDQAAEALTFSTDPGKAIAKGTAKAYLKTVLAGATKGAVVAAMAVGGAGAGATTISQEQMRRPDEHLAAEMHADDTTLQDSDMYLSTGPSVALNGQSMSMAQGMLRAGRLRRYRYKP